MANFFVSWSSPDRARVRPILTALRLHGLNLWEYMSGMPAGGTIVGNVATAIDNAQHAIFLFSDESANREWIEREMTLAAARLDQGHLESIIPVWVGPHPDQKTPQDLPVNINIRDLAVADRNAIETFAREMVDKQDEVIVTIPAAVFAMTFTEAEELFSGWTAQFTTSRRWRHEVQRLCAKLGMSSPPDLFRFLSNRYKDRPEDFTPFQDKQTIAELLGRALDRVNAARIKKQLPIAVTWLQSDFSDDSDDDVVRSAWGSHPSLLIADSISMYHPAIQHLVLQLPEITRSSILWIPPYTQRTGRLQPYLGKAIRQIKRFEDEFNKSRDWPAAYDATTAQVVDRWFTQTLMQIRAAAPAPNRGWINKWAARRRRHGVEPAHFFDGRRK